MDSLLSGKQGERGGRWRAPLPPRHHLGLAVSAFAAATATIAATIYVLFRINAALTEATWASGLTAGLLVCLGLTSLGLLVPAVRAICFALEAKGARDIVAGRVVGARAKLFSWFTFGYSGAVFLLLLVALFIIANNQAVARTFIKLSLIISSFDLVISAFWTNVYIFLIAQVLVLIWGLIIAIARLAPGPAGKPIRAITTVYTDIFRGLPAIITIYLVGFGLPLTGFPVVANFDPSWFAILALTLTYGAYVAEVYRAGIESIHGSQTAAARSLGFSHSQTLRYVVIPQAVRRIIPPLLNNFIALQKDTALVNVIGAIDAFNQSKIIASNHFNLSSVTTVALLFVLITIPQARFVDRLMERDARRMRVGG